MTLPETPTDIEAVLTHRTRYLTVVVEDLYQAHNGAAVIRACECFGIQDLHVVSNRNAFQVSEEVAAGAQNWVTVHRGSRPEEETTRAVLSKLKRSGYKIACTTLREGAIPLDEVPLNNKLAICLGTEELGLTEEAHNMADYFVHIPMYGFTQSFNISVSAALCLFDLTERLRASDQPWQLTEAEKNALREAWSRN